MRRIVAVRAGLGSAAFLLALSTVLTGCASTDGTGSPAPAAAQVTVPAAPAPIAPTTPPIGSLAGAAMPKAAPVPVPTSTACVGNKIAQLVVVSIKKQHAWMCQRTKLVYDSAVTTGETANGNDTPTGTYHVQAKQGSRYLTTLDGSSYHVDYWMPYDGVYGFHDSAWQKFAYGSSQYHTAGSHGCVHFPLTAMKWVYNWANVGSTVTIRSA
jgi:hypothetical protein